MLKQHALFIAAQIDSDAHVQARTTFHDWCLSLTHSGVHRFNPYHNIDHCRYVLDVGASIIKHATGDGCSPEFMLAALMHDYDHSGGHLSDAENIQLALNGVHNAMHHPRCEVIDIAAVEGLIECTQFDGPELGFKFIPTTLEMQAIRDADLMTIYRPDAAACLYGLFIECRVKNRKLKLDDFMKANRAFLTEAKMYTDYGNTVKDRYLLDALDQAESAMHEKYPHRCEPSYA